MPSSPSFTTQTNVHIDAAARPHVILFPALEKSGAFTEVKLGPASLLIGGPPEVAISWLRDVADQVAATFAAMSEPIPFTVTDAGRAALAEVPA